MGSWNGTCFISNLHILDDQDVVVFPVLESRTPTEDRHCCEPTAYYDPFPLPFYGKYDSYGRAEKCHGVGFKILIDYLKEHLDEKDVGENECHDIAVYRKDFNEELLWDALHKNRLTINGRQVNILMVHKGIFDDIINNFTLSSFEREDRDAIPIFYRYTIKFLKDQIKYYIDWFIEGKKLIPKKDEYLKKNLIFHVLNFYPHKFMFWPELYTEFVIQDYLDKPELEEVVSNILTVGHINDFLWQTRKSWIVPTGAGSQSMESKGYELLCKSMMSILEKEKEEFDYLNDIDEEIL